MAMRALSKDFPQPDAPRIRSANRDNKRGDTYLRTLLIAGARAVTARSGKSDWIERLLQRRHYNVVVVALANKMARTAWAVLARSMAFDRSRWNPLEPVAP